MTAELRTWADLGQFALICLGMACCAALTIWNHGRVSARRRRKRQDRIRELGEKP